MQGRKRGNDGDPAPVKNTPVPAKKTPVRAKRLVSVARPSWSEWVPSQEADGKDTRDFMPTLLWDLRKAAQRFPTEKKNVSYARIKYAETERRMENFIQEHPIQFSAIVQGHRTLNQIQAQQTGNSVEIKPVHVSPMMNTNGLLSAAAFQPQSDIAQALVGWLSQWKIEYSNTVASGDNWHLLRGEKKWNGIDAEAYALLWDQAMMAWVKVTDEVSPFLNLYQKGEPM